MNIFAAYENTPMLPKFRLTSRYGVKEWVLDDAEFEFTWRDFWLFIAIVIPSVSTLIWLALSISKGG